MKELLRQEIIVARQVRWAVAHKQNVSQPIEVYHNVGSLDGPASIFEKGLRIGSLGPWPERPTRHCVLGSRALFTDYHHLFEAKGHAMQIPEILKGIGVAVFIGTTVTDQKMICNARELCQQERGFF